MTSMPAGDAVALESPDTTSADALLGASGHVLEDTAVDPELATRITRAGLSTVLREVSVPGYERITTHLAEPMATQSRAAYAAWLRRQAQAWSELRLPAVPVSAVDWPLRSVSCQCLDVVGLLVADLREISPRTRPTLVPRQSIGADLPQPGVIVGCVDLCVRIAAPAARLLGPARALTAHLTQVGSSTRYLSRCAELAELVEPLEAELDEWGTSAAPAQAQLAVLTVRHLADDLASALDARFRTGW
jgi:hypothetical protein